MRKIIFSSEQHKDFYNTYVPQCRYQDAYHKALIYTIGIDEDTRKNFHRIYDIRRWEDIQAGIYHEMGTREITVKNGTDDSKTILVSAEIPRQ